MKTKAILAVLIAGLYGMVAVLFDRVLYAPISQSVALGQLEDSPESFIYPAGFKTAWALWDWGWILIALIILLMFWSNIKKAINAVNYDNDGS